MRTYKRLGNNLYIDPETVTCMEKRDVEVFMPKKKGAEAYQIVFHCLSGNEQYSQTHTEVYKTKEFRDRQFDNNIKELSRSTNK